MHYETNQVQSVAEEEHSYGNTRGTLQRNIQATTTNRDTNRDTDTDKATLPKLQDAQERVEALLSDRWPRPNTQLNTSMSPDAS